MIFKHKKVYTHVYFDNMWDKMGFLAYKKTIFEQLKKLKCIGNAKNIAALSKKNYNVHFGERKLGGII